MKIVKKGNLMYKIADDAKGNWLKKGFDVVDEKGRVIEKSPSNENKELVKYKIETNKKLTKFMNDFKVSELDEVAKMQEFEFKGTNKAEKVAELVTFILN